jgi:hypothetical protein
MEIMHSANVNALLDKLDGVKQTGQDKWLAKCPAHNDRNASFGIKRTTEGAILINCFAGCDNESILASVGLTFADLFPPRDSRDFDPTIPKTKPPKFSASEMVRLCVFESSLVGLAMASILQGGTLEQTDLTRVQKALDTLDEIRREVTYAR